MTPTFIGFTSCPVDLRAFIGPFRNELALKKG